MLYILFKCLMLRNNNLFYAVLFLITVTISSYAGQRMWGFIFLLLATFRSLNTLNHSYSNIKL